MIKNVQTVFASAARTATPTAVEIDTGAGENLALVIDVTAVTLTPSVTFDVNFVDPVSGSTVSMLASAAITTTGTTILQVGKDLVDVANAAANHLLPGHVQITATHADADSITYSVSAILRG